MINNMDDNMDDNQINYVKDRDIDWNYMLCFLKETF